MGKIIDIPAIASETATGPCPKCGDHLEYERCAILPNVVPLCDACEAQQAATWAAAERQRAWDATVSRCLPDGYKSATRDQVRTAFLPAAFWSPSTHRGGIGLVGPSGAGKSSAMACLLRELRRPFLWWSGTEARDAAILAATAERDRAGAIRAWEEGMTVPVLVLDDISQGKMSEGWSSRLFDLLETRMSACLPTFWTNQIDDKALFSKIANQNGGDRAQAEAIIRRLTQHSLILTTTNHQ